MAEKGAGHGRPPPDGQRPDGTLPASLQESAAAGEPARPVEPGLAPGERLADRYEVVREIGRGGFGAVYEAEDRSLGRRVALKVLHAPAPGRGGATAEAEVVARLSHPNIVQIHDLVAADGSAFLVLELLEGEPLSRRIQRGPLALQDAVRVALSAARGVAHAHVRGVVHRDLKPANVFLCAGGEVKVLDFGLAQLVGRPAIHAGGTPGWMAPEQRQGRPGDERTDVWALGAILSRCLSGDAPASSRLALPESRDLEALVEAALSEDPERRPRDATRVVEALEVVARRLGASGPSVPAPGPRSVLPRTITPLVGRDGDVAAVLDALRASPLVTLTGAGGTGKTRVAIAAAERVPREVADRAVFVDLAAVAEPGRVHRAAAAALQLRDLPAVAPVADAVAAALRDESLLLVMDNCEYVVEAAAELVAVVLAGCPGVRVLATSQLPLGLAGERVLPLAPLGAPPEDTDAGAGDLEAWAARFPALQLLVQRLRAVNPGYALTATDAPHAAEICRRLDGLPLALELVAPRSRVLSLREIAEQLDHRFQLLSRGDRTAPARQRGLAAALEWSHALLSTAEQAAVERLSVLTGAFPHSAAAAVCAPLAAGAGERVDLLQGLVEKSFVVVQRTADGGRRFRMLETIRQYGAERLRRTGGLDEVQGLLLGWAVDLAEGEGRPGRAWSDLVVEEYDNLRLAQDVAAASPERAVEGLRLAVALWPSFVGRGDAAEFAAQVGRAIALAPGAPPALRAEALVGHSVLVHYTMDARGVRKAAVAGLALASERGDERLAALARFALAWAALTEGRVAEATELADRAVASARASAADWPLAMALQARAGCASVAGDDPLALGLMREAMALVHDGFPGVLGRFLSVNLGLQEYLNGDREGARRAFLRALHETGRFALRRFVAACLEMGAYIDADQGELERAARMLGGAERLREVTGAPLFPHWRRPHDHAERRTLAALGESCAREREVGSKMPLDALADLAREVLSSSRAATG